MYTPPENQPPGGTVVQRAGDVTCAYDLNGNITFLSEAGELISGYTCAEACRMNIAELLDPEIAGRVSEQILRDAQQPVGTVSEIDIIRKDGHRVSLEVSTHAVLLDEDRIEIQGIAVPSVIRDPSLPAVGVRCLDEGFFFGSAPAVSDIIIRIS